MAAPVVSVADLLEQLGDVPAQRVRMHPTPGTATEADLLATLGNGTGRLYELVDGTLVEKGMRSPESLLAGALVEYLRVFARSHRPGDVLPADALLRMSGGNIRSPDVSYLAIDRLPDGKLPGGQITSCTADLAIEILSPSNSDDEMRKKRREYFDRGTSLVWEIDSRRETVYRSAETPDAILPLTDTLTGGDVLPGFSLPLADLFAELDAFK